MSFIWLCWMHSHPWTVTNSQFNIVLIQWIKYFLVKSHVAFLQTERRVTSFCFDRSLVMHYWDTKSWEIACFGLSSVQLLHCSVSAVEKKVVYILKDNFRNSWNFQKILEIDSWEKMIQRKEVMITRRKRFIRNQSARITSNYFIQFRKLFWWESCKIFIKVWIL